MCEALGRKPPRRSLPAGPVGLTATILEGAAHLVGRQSPITRSTIEKYTEDIAVDSSRIQTELGFKPRFDLKSGWRETIQEMRKMGLL